MHLVPSNQLDGPFNLREAEFQILVLRTVGLAGLFFQSSGCLSEGVLRKALGSSPSVNSKIGKTTQKTNLAVRGRGQNSVAQPRKGAGGGGATPPSKLSLRRGKFVKS